MVGSYMGRVFTVSSRRIFTPNNLKGSAGSDWASHEIIGGKAQSQWVGPKLKSYTMDILLPARDAELLPARGRKPDGGLVHHRRKAAFGESLQAGKRERRVGYGAERRRAD